MEAAGLDEHLRITEQLRPLLGVIDEVATIIAARRCRVLTCGNGGSAAHAQHLAAELVGRYRRTRSPLDSIALCSDSAVITAIANDFGFEQVFARQVAAHGRPGDVLVMFSASGASANCLVAARTAVSMGIDTVAFTGAGGVALASLSKFCLYVPSSDVARIQEAHQLIIHLLCEQIELLIP